MESVVDRDPRHHPQLEVTYSHRRPEFGGPKSDQVKQLKELEAENMRLRHAIADLRLDKLLLQEAVRASPRLNYE